MASPSKRTLVVEIVPGGAIILTEEDGAIIAGGSVRVVGLVVRGILEDMRAEQVKEAIGA